MPKDGLARRNWITLALLAAAAGAAGCAPTSFLVHRPLSTVWLGLAVGALALFAPRILKKKMSAADFAFEFAEMFAYSAVMGVFWLFIYGAFFATGAIIHLVSGYLFGGGWPRDAGTFAYWVTFPFMIALSLGVAGTYWERLRQRVTSGDAPGIALISRSPIAGVFAVLFAFAVYELGLALVIRRWPLFGLGLLQLSLPLISLPFWRPGGASNSGEARKAIGNLFTACGYAVTLQPRMGDEKTDALLKPLDLFAQGQSSSFALRVIASNADTADWTAASGLRSAVSAYASEPAEVQSWVVLLGIRPDTSLVEFGVKESVKVLALPDAELVQLAKNETQILALQQLALKYLHLRPDRKAAAAVNA